jgi:hypothetical protein
VNGSLSIMQNDQLQGVKGFSQLESVWGSMTISDNPLLEIFQGFQSLSSVGQELKFEHNDELLSLDSLTSLQSVGGYFRINDNPALETVQGFYNLTSIGDHLIITNNGLTQLNGFSGLTGIGGNLIIKQNHELGGLTGLENVGSLHAWLQIEDNAILSNINPLINANLSDVTLLTIKNNPMLSFCAIESICEYLDSSNGNYSIIDNAPGCNNSGEVLDACQTPVHEQPDSRDELLLFPNPADDFIYLVCSKDQKISEIRLYSHNGDRLDYAIADGWKIDISMLQGGFYYLEIYTGKDVYRKKLVKK